jgi:hypothetical protein
MTAGSMPPLIGRMAVEVVEEGRVLAGAGAPGAGEGAFCSSPSSMSAGPCVVCPSPCVREREREGEEEGCLPSFLEEAAATLARERVDVLMSLCIPVLPPNVMALVTDVSKILLLVLS